MNAEQAWQAALGQIQMEMPRASFDTWVRDTHLVSYEDGQFAIGVRNAYARDWLESRLSSTAIRLLMGIMNRSVDLRFVVDDQPDNLAEVEGEPIEEEAAVNANPAESRSDELLVEARYDVAYDEIVMPDRVTVVSGYFRRHLQVIGPDLGWQYMGFRQAAFNAGARSGTKRERFSGKVIAALSGCAERTFWNRIGKAETWKLLRGLVTTSAAAPEWDTTSPTPKRLPRKYFVAMTLPLTAADARSLRTWLTANLEGVGGPERVLAAAAETPLTELLPPDARASDEDAPETVATIVRSLFGETIAPDRLAALSSRIHKHIMPDNDRVGVTHFFVEHILPHLGAGPGWILTLLRDRCWVNRVTGETRNRVTISGGYAEIAGWLGLTGTRRARTVWDWLNEKNGPKHKEPGKYKYPVSRVFIREATQGKASDFSASPRTFDVLLDEVPQEIIEAALDEKAGLALTRALQKNADLHAVCSIEDSNHDALCSIGMTRLADDRDALCSIAMTRFADDLDATCRVFKSLNLLNQSLISKETTTRPRRISAVKQKAGGGGWDWEILFTLNQVNPTNQRNLLKSEAPAWAFVSWLLYWASARGVGLNQPVGNAIRHLEKDPEMGAGGAYDRLARRFPEEIRALLIEYCNPWQIHQGDSDTKLVFVNAKLERLDELRQRLFGENS